MNVPTSEARANTPSATIGFHLDLPNVAMRASLYHFVCGMFVAIGGIVTATIVSFMFFFLSDGLKAV